MTNDQLNRYRFSHIPQVQDFVLRLIYLLALHPGRVTSWLRSIHANATLGGVDTSYHLDGCGADLVLDQPTNNPACATHARELGLDVLDEGDHIHVELDHRKRWTERPPH